MKNAHTMAEETAQAKTEATVSPTVLPRAEAKSPIFKVLDVTSIIRDYLEPTEQIVFLMYVQVSPNNNDFWTFMRRNRGKQNPRKFEHPLATARRGGQLFRIEQRDRDDETTFADWE